MPGLDPGTDLFGDARQRRFRALLSDRENVMQLEGRTIPFPHRLLCARTRSTVDRRSHVLMLTDKGRAVLSRARKLISTRHETRLNELLGAENREALLVMLARIARDF